MDQQMTGLARSSTAGVRSGPVSTAVIDAVADANGVGPLDLEPRLDGVVDPDALDRLFRRSASEAPRAAGRLAFRMAGCDVVVRSTGRVTATPESNDDRAAVGREIGLHRPAGPRGFDG